MMKRILPSSFLAILSVVVVWGLAGCGGGGDGGDTSDTQGTDTNTTNTVTTTAWEQLAPYDGDYNGTANTSDGKTMTAALYLHPDSDYCLFILNDGDEASLWGDPVQFQDTTLSFSNSYGEGQTYTVTIKFTSYQAATFTVEKTAGSANPQYPLSGSISR